MNLTIQSSPPSVYLCLFFLLICSYLSGTWNSHTTSSTLVVKSGPISSYHTIWNLITILLTYQSPKSMAEDLSSYSMLAADKSTDVFDSSGLRQCRPRVPLVSRGELLVSQYRRTSCTFLLPTRILFDTSTPPRAANGMIDNMGSSSVRKGAYNTPHKCLYLAATVPQ